MGTKSDGDHLHGAWEQSQGEYEERVTYEWGRGQLKSSSEGHEGQAKSAYLSDRRSANFLLYVVQSCVS